MKIKIVKLMLLIFIFFSLLLEGAIASNNSINYTLAWPGILPDNKLYKFKVLRNKIIEKIIISPVKKVEFDLLMADKTVYASKLLMEKGEIELAKDTALKGENYYSILVQDYNNAMLQNKKISPDLDRKISKAALKHQEIFKELERQAATAGDKKTFQIVYEFSKINYNFILGLRNSKKINEQ